MTLTEGLAVFEIASLSGQDEVSLKKKYYHLAQKYHPDRGGSSEQFIKLREAYSYLKNAVQDPGFNKWEDEDDQPEKAQNSGSSSSTYRSNESYSYEEALNQARTYQDAYEKTRLVVEKYENIFNAQIRVINSTNVKLKTVFEMYETRRKQLELVLQEHQSHLNKQYDRSWWEYILPVSKITQTQYVQRNNDLIREFNQASQAVDDQLVSELIKLYQGNLKEVMDLLEF